MRTATTNEYQQFLTAMQRGLALPLACPICTRPVDEQHAIAFVDAASESDEITTVQLVCGSCGYRMTFYPPPSVVTADPASDAPTHPG